MYSGLVLEKNKDSKVRIVTDILVCQLDAAIDVEIIVTKILTVE